jgi:hypothetical protein
MYNTVPSYQGHAIANLSNEDLDGFNTLFLAKVIVAILDKSPRRLSSGQSSVWVRVELLDHGLRGERMCWTRQRLVGLPRDMILHVWR